jgi:hypothetical protein
MKHTTELHFIVDPDHVPTILSHLSLSSPAPALREFRIVQGDINCSQPLEVRDIKGPSSSTPIILKDGFLAEYAPNLESIKLHHTSISCTGSILKSPAGDGKARPYIQYLDLSQQGEICPNVFYGLLEAISTSITSLVLRNAGPKIESGEFKG